METIRRLNTNITLRDFRARMPRFILKGSNQDLRGLYCLSAIGMRISRFRLMACCVAWADREGSDIVKAFVDNILPPECKATNSTEGFRDLTRYEIEVIQEMNRGQFLQRAGNRALNSETREERAELEKQKMIRFKAEHDIILENYRYNNKSGPQPVSTRGRKRNFHKWISSSAESDEENIPHQKRQKHRIHRSTVSAVPTSSARPAENYNLEHVMQFSKDDPPSRLSRMFSGTSQDNQENAAEYDFSNMDQELSDDFEAPDDLSGWRNELGRPINKFSHDSRVPAYSLDFHKNVDTNHATNSSAVDSSAKKFGPEFSFSHASTPEGPCQPDQHDPTNSSVAARKVAGQGSETQPVKQGNPIGLGLGFGLDYLDDPIPDFDIPVMETTPPPPNIPVSIPLEFQNFEPEFSSCPAPESPCQSSKYIGRTKEHPDSQLVESNLNSSHRISFSAAQEDLHQPHQSRRSKDSSPQKTQDYASHLQEKNPSIDLRLGSSLALEKLLCARKSHQPQARQSTGSQILENNASFDHQASTSLGLEGIRQARQSRRPKESTSQERQNTGSQIPEDNHSFDHQVGFSMAPEETHQASQSRRSGESTPQARQHAGRQTSENNSRFKPHASFPLTRDEIRQARRKRERTLQNAQNFSNPVSEIDSDFDTLNSVSEARTELHQSKNSMPLDVQQSRRQILDNHLGFSPQAGNSSNLAQLGRSTRSVTSYRQLNGVQYIGNKNGWRPIRGFDLPEAIPGDLRFVAPYSRKEQDFMSEALEYTIHDYRSWTGGNRPLRTRPTESYAAQYNQTQAELAENWKVCNMTPQLLCVQPFTDSFDNWVRPPKEALYPNNLIKFPVTDTEK